MTGLLLNRRSAMLGAAAGALAPSFALAARDTGPGGFSRARLARIKPAMQEYIDRRWAVGIATLTWRRGEIANVTTVGMQDREAGKPMRRDTIFRIASSTKPITVAAALTLVDQGLIGLHDPVDKWLPELANRQVLDTPNGPLSATHRAPRPITMADLMTQRSGLAGDGPTPLGRAYSAIKAEPTSATLDAWLAEIGKLPLAHDPGTHWLYGASTTMLGALVARVSGMSLGQYLNKAIFDPLGMADTAFFVPPAKRGRLATVYGVEPGTLARVPAEFPVPDAPVPFGGGGGGLVSTLDDYLKFARMLLGHGRIGETRIMSRRLTGLMRSHWLTPEQRRQATQFGPAFFAGQGFGLNLAIVDNPALLGAAPYASVGSFGWNGSFGSWWLGDPVEDMINILLVQNVGVLVANAPSPFPMPSAPTVLSNLVYDAIDT